MRSLFVLSCNRFRGGAVVLGGLFATIFAFIAGLVAWAKRPRKCPRGHGRTTITAATYSSTGVARETRRCKNCSYATTRDIVLPMLTRGGSSGGSSGFSSGGSSFGGGSSGGGSAGRSY